MKKWTGMLLILSSIWLPAVCPAAYLIELKTGGTIVTSQYWKEDGQIKFYHYGGWVGIPAGMVRSVRDTELPVPASPAEISETGNEVEQPGALRDAIGKDNDPSTTESGQNTEIVRQYQAELRRINGEVLTSIDQYVLAKDQDNHSIMESIWNELNNLKGEQEELRQTVMRFYNGIVPAWWDEILLER